MLLLHRVMRCACSTLASQNRALGYEKLIKPALKPPLMSSSCFLQGRRPGAVAHVTQRHAASTAYVWVQTCTR